MSENTEVKRLEAARGHDMAWRKWGPYLSERQWGTVREDYSEDGNAWDYFSHDQARSRAHRPEEIQFAPDGKIDVMIMTWPATGRRTELARPPLPLRFPLVFAVCTLAIYLRFAMKRHRFPTSSTTKVSTVLAAIKGFVFAATCLPVLAGCATAPLPPAEARHHEAAKELHEARSEHASTEQRLGHYLRGAEAAGPLLGQGVEAPAVRDIYNTTVAECTILLRSAEGGRLWNEPLTITTGGTSYRLHYAPASRKEATWAPGYFTAFETPKQVHEDRIRRRVRDAGFGGTLVGINRPADPAKFYFPSVGVAAAVTAVLDFKPAAPAEGTSRGAVVTP